MSVNRTCSFCGVKADKDTMDELGKDFCCKDTYNCWGRRLEGVKNDDS